VNLVSKPSWLAIPLALVCIMCGAVFGASASARTAADPAPSAATSLREAGEITGIAAISSANVWAVGSTGNQTAGSDHMLIAHWNGASWTRVKNFESPGGITAISMESATDGWAIADSSTWFLIHWNGRAWSKVSGVPHPAGQMTALVAVGGDVWAGGADTPSRNHLALWMLHGTAGHWYVVPVPATSYDVAGFAAVSRTSIWAAGGGGEYLTLLHWNGTMWKTTAIPKWVTNSTFTGGAAGPDGSAWIVGFGSSSFSMHWNGKTWSPVAIPSPGEGGSTTYAVASIPGGTAWAVGQDFASLVKSVPFIVHWTGRAWTMTKTPQAGITENLEAVSAISTNDAWAAGYMCHLQDCSDATTLILHWNGKTWS
jgi:hypothetical protein